MNPVKFRRFAQVIRPKSDLTPPNIVVPIRPKSVRKHNASQEKADKNSPPSPNSYGVQAARGTLECEQPRYEWQKKKH
jgi:hypothetical protein